MLIVHYPLSIILLIFPSTSARSFIEHHTDAVDVLPQLGVVQFGVDREVNGMGNRGVVQFSGNGGECLVVQGVAHQRQIDIGTVLIVAFGAGAVDDRPLHLGKVSENLPDRAGDLGG